MRRARSAGWDASLPVDQGTERALGNQEQPEWRRLIGCLLFFLHEGSIVLSLNSSGRVDRPRKGKLNWRQGE